MDAHGDHRAQSRARSDADEIRVRQRIAEQSLIGRAASAQRRACQRDQHRARQADLPDDEGEGVLTHAAQNVPEFIRGNEHGTDREAEEQGREKEKQGEEEGVLHGFV